MISQTADYALRAVVWLASSGADARTTEQIARGTGIPAGYLSKVLQLLAKASLLRSQRGLGGGFSLARPAASISVLDVINAVDPIQRILECPLGYKGHGVHLCSLHKRLDAAIATIEETFRTCSIAELISDHRDVSPLCSPEKKGRGGSENES